MMGNPKSDISASNIIQIDLVNFKKTSKVEIKKKSAGNFKKIKIPKSTRGKGKNIIEPSADSLKGAKTINELPLEKSGGKVRLAAIEKYAAELARYIDRNKFYPQRALVMQQTGTVTLKLIVDRKGLFQIVKISKPTSHETLNKAAKDLLSRLRSFKPLPEGYEGNREFTVPINYEIEP